MSRPDSTRDPEPEKRYRVDTPVDYLAFAPIVLGFHPTDSLVVLASSAIESGTFVARLDISGQENDPGRAADSLATAMLAHRIEPAVLIAYSDKDPQVEAMMEAVLRTLPARGVDIRFAIRADDRHWRYIHADDPGGRRAPPVTYDLAGNHVTAQAVYHDVSVLPDARAFRDALRPNPPDGMAEAILHAADQVARAHADDPAARTRAGLAFVTDYLDRAPAEPGRGTDLAAGEDLAELAELAIHLTDTLVRDEAWAQLSTDPRRGVEIWQAVARSLPAPFNVPALSLLAFAGWRDGRGTLARHAAELAVDIHPAYTMPRIVLDLLRAGVAPKDWAPHPRSWPPRGDLLGAVPAPGHSDPSTGSSTQASNSSCDPPRPVIEPGERKGDGHGR